MPPSDLERDVLALWHRVKARGQEIYGMELEAGAMVSGLWANGEIGGWLDTFIEENGLWPSSQEPESK